MSVSFACPIDTFARSLLEVGNVLWRGAVILPRHPNARALAELERAVRDDQRVECGLPNVRDGIALVRKRP